MESETWRASTLKTTEVMESLKKSIFTLETEDARVSAQRADRLASAGQMIARLPVTIQERDQEIK